MHALNSSSSLPSLDLGSSAPQLTFNMQQTANDATASFTGSLNQFKSEGGVGGSKLRPMTDSGRFRSSKGGENGDLRKMWQLALRLCHKSDPDRTGQVNRVSFIQALETANPENVSEM